jgi:hypothetical protein
MKVVGILGLEDRIVEVLFEDDNEIGYYPEDQFIAEFGTSLINAYDTRKVAWELECKKVNQMDLKTAIEILEYHQDWRLGKRDDMIHEPKKLTEAVDVVLDAAKMYNKLKPKCKDTR